MISNVRYYSVIETRNTNALSEKLWNIIAPTIDSGAYGFYLHQVGGSTLAGVGQSVQYEPASALKVLYHAKSIHEESLGNTHDTDSVTYHYDPANPGNQGICPDSFSSTATTNLKNADQQMMWNSDNRMTRGIVEKYTKTAMLNYAASLGLTSTQINHNIGCPTPATHNLTTLVDLGKVYAAFRNGAITNNATWKAEFRSRMLNESNYSGFHSSICPIVNQEAAALGQEPVHRDRVLQRDELDRQGRLVPVRRDAAVPGVVGRPVDDRRAVQVERQDDLHSFVFGEYVDETTINSTSEANAINAARSKEYQEAMRGQIHAALKTW